MSACTNCGDPRCTAPSNLEVPPAGSEYAVICCERARALRAEARAEAAERLAAARDESTLHFQARAWAAEGRIEAEAAMADGLAAALEGCSAGHPPNCPCEPCEKVAAWRTARGK